MFATGGADSYGRTPGPFLYATGSDTWYECR